MDATSPWCRTARDGDLNGGDHLALETVMFLSFELRLVGADGLGGATPVNLRVTSALLLSIGGHDAASTLAGHPSKAPDGSGHFWMAIPTRWAIHFGLPTPAKSPACFRKGAAPWPPTLPDP